MTQTISHEEIVRNFLNSKAIDFNALGKFVAEQGPSIAATSRGDYGVRFGHYNILACFKIHSPFVSPVDIDASKMAAEVAGR